MLQFSIQHRIMYWLIIFTLDETAKMAELVDQCIIEAIQAATGIDFEYDEGAKEILLLPSEDIS